MLTKGWPWLAGGFTVGIAASLALYTILVLQVNPALPMHRQNIEQTVISTVIEKGVNNPQVQSAIKNQVITYVKSPEGRARMAETLKSPEVIQALSETVQTPEVQAALVKVLQTPEIRNATIKYLKDTPEMKMLSTLAAAIVPADNKQTLPHNSNGLAQ